MSGWNTRVTLINRARHQSDEDAWEEFEYYYHPFITAVLRNLRAPDSCIDDLRQTVLLKIWKALPKYRSGHFRAWMSRIIKNTYIDYIRSKKLRSDHEVPLEATVSGEPIETEASTPSNIETMIEEEWKILVSTKALEAVQNRFAGKAIKVFNLILENKSVEEVAEELGLKKNSVYRLNQRVHAALKEEIRILERHLETYDET